MRPGTAASVENREETTPGGVEFFFLGVNWTALAERSPVMIDGLYRQGAGLAFQLDAALKSSVKSVKKVKNSVAFL